MKIAQVAPLYESVPPSLYGGTERVVSYLTEALVEAGHDVTLYASGDSRTSARLRPKCDHALRLHPRNVDPVADHVLLAEQVCQDADEFDLIHSHIDYIAYPAWRRMKTPHLTTLHGRLDLWNLQNLYREFDDVPVVSISDYQRRPLPWINWISTVYHGLPEKLYTFREGRGKYLAFIGRFSREKRVDYAIKIALKAGVPLKIAAKIDKADEAYFEAKIRPLLGEPGIDYIGEIGEAEKNDFLGNALALLFPIDWPEPFGLAMIEAMACGTPVITRPRGSIPEVIEDGVSGIIFRNFEAAVRAVKDAAEMDRRKVREAFERRFTSGRMARDYSALYEKCVERRGHAVKEAAL